MPKEEVQQSERALAILSQANVHLENDHFVYVSGDHGSGWINKDVLYLVPEHVRELTALLAQLLKEVEADVVCGPATGGLVISQWLAWHLNLLSVFAEHDPQASSSNLHGAIRPPFVIRRHYDQTVRDKRIIVVDDIINTGHSIRQTIDAVQKAGGNVVCATTLCTRGNVDGNSLGAPKFVALCEIRIPSWAAQGCQLCSAGVPVNEEYAHGYEFAHAAK